MASKAMPMFATNPFFAHFAAEDRQPLRSSGTLLLPLQFLPPTQNTSRFSSDASGPDRRIAVDGKPLRYHGRGSSEEAWVVRERGGLMEFASNEEYFERILGRGNNQNLSSWPSGATVGMTGV